MTCAYNATSMLLACNGAGSGVAVKAMSLLATAFAALIAMGMML